MSSITTVVIVNWNGGEFLKESLEAIRQEKPAETIVLDNASSDHSLTILSEFPEVHVIANNANLGFGRAANQGIQQAKSEYVFLLNVDTRLLPGSVRALEQFLQDHPETAIVAPQLLFPDGRLQPSCRRFPTTARLFCYLSYLDRIIPSGYRLNSTQHMSEREVDQPMGAALMLRKSTIVQAGLFDERFFLYMEEVDLCWRLKKSGWKIHYLPQAKVLHYAGGSASKDWERSQEFFFNSVIIYFKKQGYSLLRMIMLKCSLSVALLIRSAVLRFSGQRRQSRFYRRMSGRVWSFHG